MASRMFRTSNPAIRAFERATAAEGEAMTLTGTIGKSFTLLALLMATAVVGWVFPSVPALIACVIAGLVVCIATCFKPNWAPVTAPIYALIEGYFVGVVSLIVSASMQKTAYGNAVPLAVMGTVLTFGVMLALYSTRVIKVTQTFKAVVVGATIAVALTYGVSWLLSIFWSGVWNMPIYGSGFAGIAFSVIVIGIAALNLALDFDLIESGVANRAPKFMEWYAGFALLVTLVWLYLEILRLISKLGNR